MVTAGEPIVEAVEPLHQYGRLRTNDVDQAQAVVAEVFEPHRLDPLGRGTLDARMNAVQTSSVTLGYLTYGEPASIDLPDNDTWYHVNVALSGDSKVSRSDGAVDRTRGRASAAVLLPHRRQTIEWGAHTEQIAMRIPRPSLEAHLESMVNRATRGPLDLGLRIDLTSQAGRGLLRAIDFATVEWDHSGVLTTNVAARRHLECVLLSSLLLAAPGAHQHLLDPDAARADDMDVAERAKEYLHEHAHELPTLTDVLRVVGVSARTLQTQFRAAYGCTPSQYLRGLRLRGVRSELLNPAGPDESVTDVATRWGFYHLGRFSSTYKRHFGELPSATLQSTRGGAPLS